MTEPQKYTRKPRPVWAVQFDATAPQEEWPDSMVEIPPGERSNWNYTHKLMNAKPSHQGGCCNGDYVIRDKPDGPPRMLALNTFERWFELAQEA